jgi:hypothetical protein
MYQDLQQSHDLLTVDIAQIAENETEENAILIAQTEISCLDDLSIEGDIPEDISDTEHEIDS